jgi:hypothetical protein
MKKLLTLAFLLSFGVTFVGCGGETAAPNKTPAPSVEKGTESAPAEKETPKEEPSTESAPSGDKEPAAEEKAEEKKE